MLVPFVQHDIVAHYWVQCLLALIRVSLNCSPLHWERYDQNCLGRYSPAFLPNFSEVSKSLGENYISAYERVIGKQAARL
jgi:hypothetical protein